ncbi:MAG: type II toxin-antitoxin system HicA family toxin [Bryobacteraceae bacterium]
MERVPTLNGKHFIAFHGPAVNWRRVDDALRFSELVHMLESHGFRLLKEKGSVRYYRKPGHDRLIRVDYHGQKEVPDGTCHAILKAAGIRPGVKR